MSDTQLKLKIDRLVIQSGFGKSEKMICPIMKIVQMRYKSVSKEQAYRLAKQVLTS